MTVEEIIEGIIHKEGGYVNHPNDRGGPTKYGVTQKTLSRYYGYQASIEDVKISTNRSHMIFTKETIIGHLELTKFRTTSIYRNRCKCSIWS